MVKHRELLPRHSFGLGIQSRCNTVTGQGKRVNSFLLELTLPFWNPKVFVQENPLKEISPQRKAQRRWKQCGLQESGIWFYFLFLNILLFTGMLGLDWGNYFFKYLGQDARKKQERLVNICKEEELMLSVQFNKKVEGLEEKQGQSCHLCPEAAIRSYGSRLQKSWDDLCKWRHWTKRWLGVSRGRRVLLRSTWRDWLRKTVL